MKALTLLQPWASLMVLKAPCGRAFKMFETRSWKTNYTGPIAIHASARLPRNSLYLCTTSPFREALGIDVSKSQKEAFEQIKSKLPLGQVLGVGRLVNCIPTRNAISHPWMNEVELLFGDYRANRSALIIEDMTPLDFPEEAKGKLGLWEWNPGPATIGGLHHPDYNKRGTDENTETLGYRAQYNSKGQYRITERLDETPVTDWFPGYQLAYDALIKAEKKAWGLTSK